MSKLAQNLTVLRKNNKLTQDDIAERVYVSRQAVSKWERGESVPDIETLVALSELYGVSLDDMIKKDLSGVKTLTANANLKKIFGKLKRLRRSQNAKDMTVWAIMSLACYALLCGIIQVALVDLAPDIWLFWFTLPVVPPIIFAIRFRHEIGKKWIMFFIDVPFIAAIIFFLIIFAGNEDGAWIAFLIIPVYYAVAVAVCVHQFRIERAAKQETASDKEQCVRD